jgi:hypothetical protein
MPLQPGQQTKLMPLMYIHDGSKRTKFGKEKKTMTTLLIIIVVILLFGGGGFFYSRRGRS